MSGHVGWVATSLLAALLAVSCRSGATPCSFENCPTGTTCDLDGVCRALPSGSPMDTAFRVSRHVVPTPNGWSDVSGVIEAAAK